MNARWSRLHQVDDRWLWAAAVLGAAVLLQQRGPMASDYDDVMYLHALQDRSMVTWLGERYATWSGRVGIDAVTLLVIPHVWLWRAINAVMLGLLLWSIAAVLRSERDSKLAIALMLGFLAFDPRTLFQSVLWVTGSFNYLWAAALGGVACLPFVRDDWRGRFFWVSIPAAAYASFQEQVALLLLAFQFLLMVELVRQRRASVGHGLQLAVCCAVFAVLLLAPGQARRFDTMVLYWFPEYQLLSVPERLVSGLQLSLGHAFGMGRGALPVLFAGMLWWASAAVRRGAPDRLLAALPMAVLMVPWLFAIDYRGDMPCATTAECLRKYTGLLRHAPYQDFWIGHAGNAANAWLYLSLFANGVAALAVAVVLDLVFRQDGTQRRRWVVLVWLAALASTMMLGMTPSLYLSGHRIFFMQDVLTLGLTGALFLRGRALRRSG